MLKPFRYRIERFTSQTMAADPSRVPEGVGLALVDADVRKGILATTWGLGTGVYTPAGPSPLFIHYHKGIGWMSSNVKNTGGWRNWAVRDAASDVGAVSYVTQLTEPSPGTITVARPRILEAATSNPMGIDPPATLNVPGGSGTLCQVAVTYAVQDATGGLLLESNPIRVASNVVTGVTATAAAKTDGRVTHYYWYATQANDPKGLAYFVAKTTTPTWLITLTGQDTARPLTWGPFGNIGNPTMLTDHSPMPPVTVLPDRLHGGDVGADQGAGLLMFGINDMAGWCRSGQPQYAPQANRFQLPGTIQAIVSKGYTSFYFLPEQIWTASGQDDSSIIWNQSSSRLGVRLAHGGTVVDTHVGVLFLSREGLALFDGSSAQLIDKGFMSQAMWGAVAQWTAGYHDGVYYIGSPQFGGSLAIDLSSGLEAMSVTTLSGVVPTAFHSVPVGYDDALAYTTDPEDGMFFVMDAVKGKACAFSPIDGAKVNGATQTTAVFLSGTIDMGEPTRRKRAHRMRLDGKGRVTVRLMHDPVDPLVVSANPFFQTVVTLPAARHFKLAQSCAGQRFQVRISVEPGAELRSFEFEGSVG